VLRSVISRHESVTGLSWTVPGTGVASLTGVVGEFGGRVQVRTGLLHHLGNMAALGGTGVLCFDGNVVPALVSSAWSETISLGVHHGGAFGQLLALNAALSRYGNPASIKAALRHLGLPAGALRRPFLGLESAEEAELAAWLDRLDVLP